MKLFNKILILGLILSASTLFAGPSDPPPPPTGAPPVGLSVDGNMLLLIIFGILFSFFIFKKEQYFQKKV